MENGNRLANSGGTSRSLQRKNELASSAKHNEDFGSMIFEFILSFIGFGGVNSIITQLFLYTLPFSAAVTREKAGEKSGSGREERLLCPTHFDYIVVQP